VQCFNDFFVKSCLSCGERLKLALKVQLQEDVFHFEEIAEHMFKQTCSFDWFLYGGSLSS
jgi:hypothetical protein